MATKPTESGADFLRRVVRACDMTRDSALDGYTAEEIIKIISACWASPFDILPDDLMEKESDFAARRGVLSARALARLDREL